MNLLLSLLAASAYTVGGVFMRKAEGSPTPQGAIRGGPKVRMAARDDVR